MAKETEVSLKELQEKIYRLEILVEELMKREGIDIVEKTIIANPASTVVTDRNKWEDIIVEQLKELGISAHLLGYLYIKEAVLHIIEDKSCLKAITKELYPVIAKKFDKTSISVERAIRYAVETVFKRGNYTKIEEMFFYTISYKKGKATNAEFLATLTEEVEMRKARD